MIYLTPEQTKKLELLDLLFNLMSVEDLEKLTEADHIVSRLKGDKVPTGFLKQLVLDGNQQSTDAVAMRGELLTLRQDISVLIKALVKPFDYQTQSEINNLKSRYGVY